MDTSMEEGDQVEEGDTGLPVIEKQELIEVDTSEEFAEVFGSKNEFDSWDEFTALLEEFQRKTGSSFKPRSASSVEYANERRINGPIPKRFVYANVKMICVHFGLPFKKGSRKSYVGKGCGAFMNVSYCKGALRISQSHLIHINHPLDAKGESTPLRQFRVFNFTDELDLIIAKEVKKCNPFEYANSEKRWLQAVNNLKEDDERFADLTPRLIKKRIRFLVDKFLAFSHGKLPSLEDELGNILYELDQSRKETRDNPTGKRRGPGRPRKKRNLSPQPEDDEDINGEESQAETSTSSPSHKRGRPPTQALAAASSQISSDINSFLVFLRRKDEQDQRMRQQEIDLRKEELALQRREMDLQKQKFELDRIERKAHMELMNAQLRALENSAAVKAQPHLKETSGPVEYTIVVDNNNQMLEAVPSLAVT